MKPGVVLYLDAATEQMLRSTDPLPGVCTHCGLPRWRCRAWVRASTHHPLVGSHDPTPRDF